MLFALFLSFIVVNLSLKPLVARVRPYEVNTAIQILTAPFRDFSFPSGHSSFSFAGATAIFFYNKRLSIYAFILATAIAFSRLYLYVHYPSDVLAGILIGVLCGIISYQLTLFMVKKYREL